MRRAPVVYLALFVFTLIIYWPITRYGFINYDDPEYVVKNSHVQSGLSTEGIRWAFTSTESSNWHPLTWISHMLDCQLFGLNAHAHHVVNLGFHIANALLLLLTLQQLTGAPWRSAFVAALFAWHPLHIESVAWIAERKDVLSSFFALLTVHTYLRYVRQRTVSTYVLALLFFVLGVMAKPMIVTLPMVLLLLDFWPLRRFMAHNPRPARAMKSLVVEKIPFFVLALAASSITFWAQYRGGSVESLNSLTPGARVANACLSYALYLAKMFWPAHLSVFYPHHAIPLWNAVGAASLLGIITGISIWKARVVPYLFVGWFWFVIMLLPVIGLVQVGAQAMADRYTYLPLIGLFLIFTWGAGDIVRQLQWPNWAITSAASGLLLACALNTRFQLAYWQDSATLFTHSLAVTSENPVAFNNLGSAFLDAGRFEEAKTNFQAALALRPGYPNALFNLGALFQSQGKLDEAGTQFRLAVQSRPDYRRAHNALATILILKGKHEEAESHLRTALELQPADPDARRNLGYVLALQGKNEEAQTELERALRHAPTDVILHQTLAHVFSVRGDFDQAIREFSTALQLNPTNNLVRETLASLLIKENKPEEALALLKANSHPTVGTHALLAAIAEKTGDWGAAIQHYNDALQLKPGSPGILNNLAWILATNPDDNVRKGAKAVELAEEACRLSDYKQPTLIGTLGAAYAEAGRFPDAITAAEKACESASAAGNASLLKKNQELLQLYRASRPYRESR
jgi:Flp pilus assembly protein TadD